MRSFTQLGHQRATDSWNPSRQTHGPGSVGNPSHAARLQEPGKPRTTDPLVRPELRSYSSFTPSVQYAPPYRMSRPSGYTPRGFSPMVLDTPSPRSRGHRMTPSRPPQVPSAGIPHRSIREETCVMSPPLAEPGPSPQKRGFNTQVYGTFPYNEGGSPRHTPPGPLITRSPVQFDQTLRASVLPVRSQSPSGKHSDKISRPAKSKMAATMILMSPMTPPPPVERHDHGQQYSAPYSQAMYMPRVTTMDSPQVDRTVDRVVRAVPTTPVPISSEIPRHTPHTVSVQVVNDYPAPSAVSISNDRARVMDLMVAPTPTPDVTVYQRGSTPTSIATPSGPGVGGVGRSTSPRASVTVSTERLSHDERVTPTPPQLSPVTVETMARPTLPPPGYSFAAPPSLDGKPRPCAASARASDEMMVVTRYLSSRTTAEPGALEAILGIPTRSPQVSPQTSGVRSPGSPSPQSSPSPPVSRETTKQKRSPTRSASSPALDVVGNETRPRANSSPSLLVAHSPRRESPLRRSSMASVVPQSPLLTVTVESESESRPVPARPSSLVGDRGDSDLAPDPAMTRPRVMSDAGARGAGPFVFQPPPVFRRHPAVTARRPNKGYTPFHSPYPDTSHLAQMDVHSAIQQQIVEKRRMTARRRPPHVPVPAPVPEAHMVNSMPGQGRPGLMPDVQCEPVVAIDGVGAEPVIEVTTDSPINPPPPRPESSQSRRSVSPEIEIQPVSDSESDGEPMPRVNDGLGAVYAASPLLVVESEPEPVPAAPVRPSGLGEGGVGVGSSRLEDPEDDMAAFLETLAGHLGVDVSGLTADDVEAFIREMGP